MFGWQSQLAGFLKNVANRLSLKCLRKADRSICRVSMSVMGMLRQLRLS